MKRNQICFAVDDFLGQAQRNSELILRLEKDLAAAGAVPVRVDTEEEIFCVEVVSANLDLEGIETIFSQAGCTVHRKGDEDVSL